MSKKLTPQLRFKGFEDEWQEHYLSELGEVKMCKRILKSQTSENGEVPFYKIGTFGKKPDAFISKELFDQYKKLYSFPKFGDIIVSAAGTIGRTVVFDGKPAYFQDSNLIWIDNDNTVIDNSFLSVAYPNIRWAISSTTIARIYNDTVRKTKTSAPVTILEQREIGEFFKQIDELIAEARREIERLEKMKLASLQKMFPRPGAITPEIRFTGFKGDWELKCLGEIGSTYTGLSGKTKEDFGHGCAHFITYMNVFSNPIASPKQVEPIEIDKSQYAVRYGDIFFTTSSETPEEVGMSSVWLYDNNHVYLNSFCFGFRPNVKIDLKFIAYFLRSPFFRSQMFILAQGISRFNISKLKAMELPVLLPSLSEQQAIGEYFCNLDSLLSAKREKLSKLRNIKQACLDKMFVNTSDV